MLSVNPTKTRQHAVRSGVSGLAQGKHCHRLSKPDFDKAAEMLLRRVYS
jgi:hypothetical protein